MKVISTLRIAIFLILHLNAQEIYPDPIDLVPFSLDWHEFSESDLDLSFLLQKPAGRGGFTKIREGHFYTADNQRLRIWGVNVTGGACFPEKEDAPQVAEFLARLGINGVRFHFLDSNWGPEKSIFNYDLNHTRELDKGQLDRLDFFVSELKNQGIYTNFNLNVGRNYREGDNVADYKLLGLAKAVTLFDEHLIKLQKEYARQLLTHTNPYTGNSYIAEPALILVEIVNENSLVEAWFSGRLLGENKDDNPGTWSDIPASYAGQLTRNYNDWLITAVSPDDLKKMKLEAGVKANDRLPRLRPDEFRDASRLRFHAEAEFIMGLESAFFRDMYSFLKEELKLRAHVAGNSDHNHYKPGYALLSSLSQLDVIDGHVYWQHPSYMTNPETGERTFRIKNSPMVNDPMHSTVVQLSRSAVAGMPYTVSETNHPFPNEYACEGIGILAAYGLFQDWDGIFFYTLEHDDPKIWSSKTPRYFDLYSDPVKMTNLAAAALMFHRGDVKSAPTTIMRNYSHEQLIEGIREDRTDMPMFTPGFSPAIPLKYGTRIQSFENGQNGFPNLQLTDSLFSETKELSWHLIEAKGVVAVNTPQTQAIIGFVRDSGRRTENMKPRIENPFCSLMLSSIDGARIDRSEKLLFAATARSGLSGMEWNEERTSLTSWGEKPTLIEPVQGQIVLYLNQAKRVRLMPLDGSGSIQKTVYISPSEDGSFVLELTPHKTPWYLFDVEFLSD